MKEETHIDDVQPPSVEEHFKLLVEDKSTIDPEYVKVTPKDLPHWFDERLFKIGQNYYMNNLLAFAASNSIGLISILCIPDILEVMQYTKKSETVFLSFKRYAETMLLTLDLYNTDMLNPGSKWFEATNTIRWRHSLVCKKRMKQGLHAIYQKDMVITQFGFIGFAMIVPQHIGLAHSTQEELTGFSHFWRVTGHLLGISERMNLVRKSVAETTELCRRIATDIISKNMKNPPPEFMAVAGTAIDGLWYVDQNLNKYAFFQLTYSLFGAKNPEPLGWYATINYKHREWMLYLCSAPYIGIVVRTTFNYILSGLYWMLNHYPLIAWLRFGKKESKLCIYANIK